MAMSFVSCLAFLTEIMWGHESAPCTPGGEEVMDSSTAGSAQDYRERISMIRVQEHQVKVQWMSFPLPAPAPAPEGLLRTLIYDSSLRPSQGGQETTEFPHFF